MSRALRFAAFSGAVAVLTALGCSVPREQPSPPTYDETVAPLLAQRCVACHASTSPAGGWRASTFIDVIACVAGERAAVLPASGDAPILAVLSNATHAPLLSADEKGTLAAWVRAGSPKYRGTAHAPSFVDPRSEESHGRMLRRTRWSAMLDANDPASCGRCHDGAPSRPAGVTTAAPGAPACTTCHVEPGAALACSTCHGRGAGAYPPRDPCFFPGEAALSTAHAAHVEATSTHGDGVPCSTCHPAPGEPVIGGTHGNGVVDVRFDSFDPATKACTTACHARGGARQRPAWTEKQPMGCGDCHASPPAGHFAGPCTSCHREADATGTAFVTTARLHLNGRVDLGDGSGACGACHGAGPDPWPATGAHARHHVPEAAAEVPCASCHTVPASFGAGTGHPRGGAATVVLSGLAVKRGPAAYTGGSCRDAYCHGAATPSWTDVSGAARACGACHALPPPGPHPAATACALCHHDAIVTASGPQIAPAWAKLHVNGAVDR